MRWVLLSITLAILGCKAEPEDCATLDANACSDAPSCAPINGFLLGEAGESFCEDGGAASEVVGCADAELTCPAVEVYGQADADSPAYLVPAGCLPSGWSALEGPYPECVDDCSQVDLADCASTAGCMQIDGIPLVETGPDGYCLDFTATSVPLECVPETGCGDAEAIASDGTTGAPHWFPDTCVPTGWTVDSEPVSDCP